MNLQMTTSQKVVAAFIGLVIITIGLGIGAHMAMSHYANKNNCNVDTSQAKQVQSEGLTPIAMTVCGSAE